ncbi:MAG: YabP/YqfC family sporulation protein [Coprobacillaceae bacterium]
METSLGFLNITGTELSLIRLDQDKNEVSIKGNIDSVSYVVNKKSNKSKESMFNKLLK